MAWELELVEGLSSRWTPRYFIVLRYGNFSQRTGFQLRSWAIRSVSLGVVALLALSWVSLAGMGPSTVATILAGCILIPVKAQNADNHVATSCCMYSARGPGVMVQRSSA